MRTCPNCEFLLPAEATSCQFCKVDIVQWSPPQPTAAQPVANLTQSSAFPAQPGAYTAAPVTPYPSQPGAYQMPVGAYPAPTGDTKRTSTGTILLAVGLFAMVALLAAIIGVGAITKLGSRAEVANGPASPSEPPVAESSSDGGLTAENCGSLAGRRIDEIEVDRLDETIRPAVNFLTLLSQMGAPGVSEGLVEAGSQTDVDTALAKLASKADTVCNDPDTAESMRSLEVIPPLLRVAEDPTYCEALTRVATEGVVFVADPDERKALMNVAPELHRDTISALPNPYEGVSGGGGSFSAEDAASVAAIGIYAEGVCRIPGAAVAIANSNTFTTISNSI